MADNFEISPKRGNWFEVRNRATGHSWGCSIAKGSDGKRRISDVSGGGSGSWPVGAEDAAGRAYAQAQALQRGWIDE